MLSNVNKKSHFYQKNVIGFTELMVGFVALQVVIVPSYPNIDV